MVGDSVTTDHISPAGSIGPDTPAGRYLTEHGVAREDFNSYGARRGNHEVMMRGTFANVRLRNRWPRAPRAGDTCTSPTASETSIYEAAMQYAAEGVPLVVLAGRGVRDRARAGTGRPRAPPCSACAPSSPRATSASTAPTWSAWASSRCSSTRATRPRAWA
jgi:hypothetical protein